MVPRNKQTPNTDKVVMENYIPVFNVFLPRREDLNSTGFLNFRLAPVLTRCSERYQETLTQPKLTKGHEAVGALLMISL